MYLFRSMISRIVLVGRDPKYSGWQVGITSLSPASIDEHQRGYSKANECAVWHRPGSGLPGFRYSAAARASCTHIPAARRQGRLARILGALGQSTPSHKLDFI